MFRRAQPNKTKTDQNKFFGKPTAAKRGALWTNHSEFVKGDYWDRQNYISYMIHGFRTADRKAARSAAIRILGMPECGAKVTPQICFLINQLCGISASKNRFKFAI